MPRSKLINKIFHTMKQAKAAKNKFINENIIMSAKFFTSPTKPINKIFHIMNKAKAAKNKFINEGIIIVIKFISNNF